MAKKKKQRAQVEEYECSCGHCGMSMMSDETIKVTAPDTAEEIHHFCSWSCLAKDAIDMATSFDPDPHRFPDYTAINAQIAMMNGPSN